MKTSDQNLETIAISDIRDILSDDFLKNEIDRLIMAIRCQILEEKFINIKKTRQLLQEDFSQATITRVVMVLKNHLDKIPEDSEFKINVVKT